MLSSLSRYCAGSNSGRSSTLMVLLIFIPFAFQQCGQSLSPLDIFLLCAFGTARKQQDDLRAALRVIQTPARAEVYAQLNHAIANRLEVSQQAEGEALDSFHHRAAYPVVFQSTKLCCEFGKRFDEGHGLSVIERLRNVNQESGVSLDCSQPSD